MGKNVTKYKFSLSYIKNEKMKYNVWWIKSSPRI